jgi:hypothetical protein
VSLPVGFTRSAKTEVYFDKEGKAPRRSPIGKNEYYRAMPQHAEANPIPFRDVMNAAWYSSADALRMRWVKQTLHKDLILPRKVPRWHVGCATHRKVALRLADTVAGQYSRVDALDLAPHTVRELYLEGVAFPLLFTKRVFVNEDGRRGVQYLVTSDLTLSADGIATLYRTRWPVDPFHRRSRSRDKSLK